MSNNKNVTPKQWCLSDKNLIALAQKYPVIYYTFTNRRPGKAFKAQWDNAWKEIETQLSQPSKICKQIWSEIKYKYAKLMNLINSGKITKEVAISHQETGRFFDGQLSFLDQFIDINDEQIPFRIHKYINGLFGLHTKRTQSIMISQNNTQYVTHEQVKALIEEREIKEGPSLDNTDMQYLQTVVDTAIKRKLEELQLINKTSSNDDESIINVNKPPTKKNPDVRKRKPSLGLQSELIIENDFIKAENEIDGEEENLTLDKNINTNRQIVIPTQNNDAIIIEYNTENIATADNEEEALSDDYVKNFFKELGEVMSVELTMSKQNILRSRINELVKTLLLPKQ